MRSVLLVCVLLCCSAAAQELPGLPETLPEISIVYPKDSQTVASVDSTFLFGHLPSGLPHDFDDYVVIVNGDLDTPFPVHKRGGWLAWIPLKPDDSVFMVEARLGRELESRKLQDSDTSDIRRHLTPMEDQGRRATPGSVHAAGSLFVHIPKPFPVVPPDSMAILGDYRPPGGDIVLRHGDQLGVSFRGTPGKIAWCSIPGITDSLPMVEAMPEPQPYWGESVFGAGNVPDSLLIHGIYSGFVEVPDSVSIADTTITYRLALNSNSLEVIRFLTENWFGMESFDTSWFDLLPSVTATSGYQVSFNHPDYPFTVHFTDSVQIIRHGPRRGYFATLQPEGVEALAVGREGDWYKLQLSDTQYAWAAAESCQPLGGGLLPPQSLLRVIRTYDESQSVRVEFPLAGKHAYQVEEVDRRTVVVRLFGVTSDTDWIRYDFSDSLLDFASWHQPEPGLYELTVHLTTDLWGYECYYVGNLFNLRLMKPPTMLPRVGGMRIVIDPGHSSDPGAIGPTELTEAEANLSIARELKTLLRWRGADVIMTRDDDSHVDLYDRPAIAVNSDADLFISIHNNALPDGVNPFANNGSATFYYHPHSLDLAKAIQRRLIPATGLADFGLYHGNLAVARPTQYPAVLVECAFMMIPDQEDKLRRDRSFRIEIARAIATGLDDFLQSYHSSNR